MDEDSLLERTTLLERTVLLGVVGRAVAGETPARIDEIRSACNEDAASVTGRLSEGDVARSLNRLSSAELLEETPSGSSPVGKGRPAYALREDPDAVLGALEADSELEPVVEAVERRS